MRPSSLIAATTGLLMLQASARADERAPAAAPSVVPLASDCTYPYLDEATVRFGSRVLALGRRNWVLFDDTSRTALTSGDWGQEFGMMWRFRPELSGDLLLAQTRSDHGDAVQLIDARDVHGAVLLRDGKVETHGGFARDGSYLWLTDDFSVFSLYTLDGQPFLSFPSSRSEGERFFAANEARALSNPDEIVDVATGTRRTLPPHPMRSSASWFEDGAHYIEYGTDGRTRIYTAHGELVQDFKLSSGVTTSDGRELPAALQGYGAYFFSGSRRTAWVYRLGAPLDTAGTPVAVMTFSHPDEEAYSPRVVRGTLALYGHKSSVLRMLDLRADLSIQATVTLPAPLAGTTFSSDDQGRWSIAVNDRVYASDGPLSTSFHVLGCRAP